LSRSNCMRYGGWYQIAFENGLKSDLTSVSAGDRRLLCLRRESGFDVFDAVCPHRGADLGVGGKLADGCVICPYHGHRVALGADNGAEFSVAKYPSITVGGLVFALIGDFEHGALPRMLDYLNRTHKIFPGFEKSIRIAPEMVIENAFDWAHFPPVHDVLKVTYGQPRTEDGVFTAELTLRVGPSMWQGTDDGTHHDDGDTWVEVPLLARAYSPCLTITQVAIGGGDHPHFVIASAVPQMDGSATVRLSVALPLNADGSAPTKDMADIILQFESMGLEQDRPVWENLAVNARPRYTDEDANVLAFRQWCNRYSLERIAGGAHPAPRHRARAEESSIEDGES
ncbi:MAG TPA: Rieske 2Fe-2S domain-containing protein, partial [Candidatus Acidoferrum sp.]|nr:Rieske 2Fe-2S domain-containing protein [Candidatus Acidoferrum sp.]